MEVTSTIEESINIPQATEEAIFDPLPDSIKENLAVVMVAKLPLLFKNQWTFTRLLKKQFLIHFLM